MKFLTWIEIKFGMSNRSRGWLIKRKIRKKEFVIKYKNLCDKLFNKDVSHSDYCKTTEGLHLVGLARKELQFSDNTYGGDIYYGLFRTYQDAKSELEKL